MKKVLLSAASALMLLGSCSQNEWEENALSGSRDVVATIEGQGESRLAVEQSDNVFKLSWSTGDAFKVFGENSTSAVYNWVSDETFSIKDGDTAPETPQYAVYPYSDENSPVISGSEVTLTLNATPSVDNINLPMWAGAPTGTNYAFKHLAAALQFTLNDIPAGYNQLVVVASNAICGTFKADLSAEEPMLEFGADVIADGNKTVTVSFTAVDENTQNQVFYIPLPAGTYESLKVSVSNGSDAKELKSWTGLEVKRGKMYYTTATVDVSTVAGVNAALENAGETPTTVNLTAEIETTTAISIPEEAKDVTMNFGTAPKTTSEAPLTINQNADATSGEATSVLNINMPTGATDLYAAIDAPTTTVTLTGGSYEKVTATTATNTLIIGENVTVTNMIITAGNVRINDGGQVTSVSRSDNADEKTYVIYEGTLPTESNSDSNIVYISADEWDLRKKIEDETIETITLDNDVILTSQLTISRSLTLDLNGHTLSNTTDIWNDADGVDTWSLVSVQGTGVTVAITGEGKLQAKENDCFAVDVRNGAVVNVENGTYVGNISAVYAIDGGTANIKGGTYSIQQLSSYSDYRYLLNLKDNTESSIVVTGGTFNNFNPANCLAEGENTNFVAEGYSSVQNGESYVVSQGIKNEQALLSAVQGAGNDAEIILADDIVLTTQLTINKSLTLNLNGHTLSNTTGFYNTTNKLWSLVSVQGSGVEVTITGNGSLSALKDDCYAADVRDDATVNIENGTYVGNISAVYAIDGGKANIKGGTYSIQQLSEQFNDYRYLLNLKDNTESSIIVTGGTFNNFNPADCLAEGENTNFVADGYKSSTSDDGATYVVTKDDANE